MERALRGVHLRGGCAFVGGSPQEYSLPDVGRGARNGTHQEEKEKGLKNKKSVYTIICVRYTHKNGGAPGSIAGERKDKHTVDGVTTIKHST